MTTMRLIFSFLIIKTVQGFVPPHVVAEVHSGLPLDSSIREFLSPNQRSYMKCPAIKARVYRESENQPHFLMNSPGDEEYQEDPELSKERDPKDPSPFALFLVDGQFKKFEEKVNEELKFINDKMHNGQFPIWSIDNYKAYFMKAYCLLRIMYTVLGDQKTGDGTCDHLIEPNAGDEGCVFTINYVISKSEKDIRTDAQQCLKKMLDQNFGKEFSTRYPPLHDVYKVCIALKGHKAAVEFSRAPPQK